MLGAASFSSVQNLQHNQTRRQRLVSAPYQHVIRDLVQLKAATGMKISLCKSRVFDEEMKGQFLNEQTVHEAIKQSYHVFKKGCKPATKQDFIKTFGRLLALDESEIESVLDQYFHNGGYCTHQGHQSVLHLMTRLYMAKNNRPLPSAPPFPQEIISENLPIAVLVEEPHLGIGNSSLDSPVAVPIIEAEVIAAYPQTPPAYPSEQGQVVPSAPPLPGSFPPTLPLRTPPATQENTGIRNPGYRIELHAAQKRPHPIPRFNPLNRALLGTETPLCTPVAQDPPEEEKTSLGPAPMWIEREKKTEEKTEEIPLSVQQVQYKIPGSLIILLYAASRIDLYDRILKKLEDELFDKTNLPLTPPLLGRHF